MQTSLRLRDGRNLGYASSGDPNGLPVFFFHGTPGSRLFQPPEADTRALGIRLVTLDRPGYGNSDFQPGRTLLDWPEDVKQLADHLGIDRFFVCGHSGGGPHTLACAARLGDRIRSAATLSGAGPAHTPQATRGMSPLNRIGFLYGRLLPWPFWRLLIRMNFRRRQLDPAANIQRESRSRPAADEHLLADPDVRRACVDSEVEAFRQGLRGLAWDAHLLVRPWNFELSRIQIPVHIWHGTADTSTTPAMAAYLAGSIPGARLHMLDHEAHLLLFPHWAEILTTLTSE
jgi:pimeloyl-ACP methyl ester carboxylesterase